VNENDPGDEKHAMSGADGIYLPGFGGETMKYISVFCILLTTIFVMIIACECVAGEYEYHELWVTLHDDGTEHTYIMTTHPDYWTCYGTFWESGDAYNKEETTYYDYTVIVYDLDDIDLYDQGALTSLHSEGSGDSTIWIYHDEFIYDVDVYILKLPTCGYIDSKPEPDEKSGNKLTWYNISEQETRFSSDKYNDLSDRVYSENDNGDPYDEIYHVDFCFIVYILPILIGLLLGMIGYRYDKPNWAVGVTIGLPFLLSWFGLLGAFSLLSKSKPEVDVVSHPPNCPRCRSLLKPGDSFCHYCGTVIRVVPVANYPPQPQQPPPPQQSPPPPTHQPPSPKESVGSDEVQEPVVRLHRLKEIKDLGLITDEDYNLKKEEILKDL